MSGKPPNKVPVPEYLNARFVKTRLSVTEQGCLETLVSYGLRPKIGKGRVIPKSYSCDAFFLFPDNSGTAAAPMALEKFYENFSCYIRFREPKLSYKELMGLRKGGASSIEVISEYLHAMIEGRLSEPPGQMIDEVRYFGASYFRYCRRKVLKPLENRRKETSEPEIEAHSLRNIFSYLERASQILVEWRKLSKLFQKLPKDYLKDLRVEFRHVNEYCSYVYRDAVLGFACVASLIPEELPKKVNLRIGAMVRFERWYARKEGFIWLEAEDSKDQWEQYLFRKERLRQKIWSNLFLRLKGRGVLAFQRHLGPMLAAAFAGAWAVLISVMVGVELISGKEGLLSLNAFLVVLLLTFAYVLKDRIKEIGRSAFRGGILMRLPDASNRMMYRVPGTSRPSKEIGRIVENSHYLSSGALPTDVKDFLKVMAGDIQSFWDRNTSILGYSRNYVFNSRAILDVRDHLKRVYEVSTLDLSPFVNNFQSPSVKTTALSGKEVVDLEVARVNKIDLVMRISAELPGYPNIGSYLALFRLTIGSEGLIRVETIGDSQNSKRWL